MIYIYYYATEYRPPTNVDHRNSGVIQSSQKARKREQIPQ